MTNARTKRIIRRLSSGLALCACIASGGSPQSAHAQSTPPPATTGSSAQPGEVDLLHATEASVEVSSEVANHTDRQENLVDGDPSTVWSSATGQMTRTWIAVRLPRDARVTAIEMTAGYTRPPPATGRDLFTANVRINRVRITRNGAPVGEFDLDVNSRALQRLPVQGAGGEWLVETIGVVPGSERNWREVSVSEFRVLGMPGTVGRRATPAAPTLSSYAYRVLGMNEALRDARHNLLQEGIHPDDGDYGCSGSFATTCIRTSWIQIADAAVSIAEARCGTRGFADYRLHYHALRRLHERQGRISEHDGDTDAIDPRADASMARFTAAAQSILDGCRQDPRLHGVSVLLGNDELLRSFVWR